MALEFNYPSASHEQRIIEKETSSDSNIASRLVKLGSMTRNLKGNGLDEGASTRLLVNAAKLISGGISPVTATDTAIAQALTDDVDMLEVIQELCRSVF